MRAAIWPGPVSSPCGGGGEGKGRAGADAEDAGDDSGVAHADADDVGVVVHRSRKRMRVTLSERVLGGGDDLDEVGRKGWMRSKMPVEVFGGVEVVVADDEGDAGLTELLEVGLLDGFGGLEFEVDDVEAGARQPW